MRRLLISCLFVMSAVMSWAVGAYPHPVDVRQPDGSILTIQQHGDEYFNYVTTTDGMLLYQEGNTYYVASVDKSGLLSKTDQLAHNAVERGAHERELASAQDRALFMSKAASEQRQRRVKGEPVDASHLEFPHTGSPRVVVILAEFADTTFTLSDPRASFDQYLNGEGERTDYGYGERSNYESVREYFKACSFGQFTPVFDIYGPVQLSDNLSVYGGNNSKGTGERMDLLISQACTLMDDSLDFSQYDANDDGYVDLVVVIYAGYSQAVSGNTYDCIWPKSGNTSGGTHDGKKVSRYAVSAELNGFPGCYSSAPYKRINGIGVFCHEFSHCLGLPDFYPTIDSVKGDNQAMEFWSLMDSGCYLINGTAPVAYTAWEREALGWMEIEDLDEGCELSLVPLDEGGHAYRIRNDSDETHNEYYIIENIQDRGINVRQKGHGLLMSHVNYNANAFSLSSNSVNNVSGSPRMTIVPADGCLFAQYNIDGVNYRNADFYNQLAGDPFPGTSEVISVNDDSGLVNFGVYNGTRLNKALADISESEDGTVTLRYISDYGAYSGISDLRHDTGYPKGIYTIGGSYAGTDASTLPKGIYIMSGKKKVVR